MIDKKKLKENIKRLIEKYELSKKSFSISKYSEEETKKDFILPLFASLGWDVTNKNEVTAEESQSSGRVDYGFYLEGRIKFYLEAKSLKTDLHREEYANQAIRYSWNKGVTWAVLTDFESIKVFNVQDISKKLGDKLFFEIPYSQYFERLDQLWLLSKDAFKDNLLDIEAEKYGKKLQKISVGTLLYKDLNTCRDILTHDLSAWNDNVSKDLLDEGVQKILDRLIFIRVAEDREVEPPTLIPLIREWESRKDRNKIPLYKSMVAKFRELNEIYNSNLFSEHPFEEWEDHSDATKRVVDILYGKKGYYEYDFKVIPADVLGSVYENYLGYRLSKSRKGMTLDIDARKRKEQGIYYTPDFIVDYIVKNSLKPVLDKCKNINDLKKIKVLDPACGSGSFLIKALEVIYDKYREFGNPGGVYTKLTILLDNIFGVDLDSQAVEIARLNLLINTLDNRMRLPPLDKNIKNGNSLISGSDEESKKYFGKNYRDKKPFNWQEEFPDVFKQGGFGAIVGNPPYIQLSMDAKQDNDLKKYLLDKYQSSMGRLNTFGFFIRLGIDLLKENGILGFIIPNTLLTQDYYRQLRETILNYCIISNIVTFQDLPFKDAVVENIIIIVQKTKSERERNNNKVIISYVNEKYEILSRKKINQRIFYESKQKTFNIRAGQKNMILKQKIEEAAEPLGNFLTINQAIALKHDRSKYLFDKKLNANYKPVLDGRDITRYFLCWSGKYLNYDIDAIHSCKRQDIFLSREKLFFRRVGDRLIATYDGKQFYALNTLVVMNLKEGIEYNLKYCLALFNSSLLNYYFLNFLKSTKKVFSEIQARQVAQLPIKIINFSKPADKAIHDRIVDLAQSMLNLNKQLANLSVNSNEWLEIQTEIGRIDKRLNAEIYKLYSLTSEEIAIVEGERKSKAFLQVSKL